MQTDFTEQTEVWGIPIGCGMKMNNNLLKKIKLKSKLCLNLKGCQMIRSLLIHILGSRYEEVL